MDQENIFTVTEINQHLKHIIEHNIPNLFIEGEISNFTWHNSGHIYFSLKDEKSMIRCVFFRSYNSYLDFRPKEGDKVICAGKISVYERSGNYQLNVTRMIVSGIGELQLKFEKLKKKLEEEGLFETKFKKPIPKFPEKIGVITSETGAAIQDIKSVIARRFPCRIFLFPATVQGGKAANEIINGIHFFNEQFKVDLIILGRGGGSQEDLFCFNDEKLGRIIFASEIPIISAVGHEIDFTISDFVADLRAPTPSAAAELAVPDKTEVIRNLESLKSSISKNTLNIVFQKKIKLNNLQNLLLQNHPEKKLQIFQQQFDEMQIRLKHAIKLYFLEQQQKLDIFKQTLKELSPYEILKRGYNLIRENKKIVRSVHQLEDDMKLEIIFSDGNCKCTINNLEKNLES